MINYLKSVFKVNERMTENKSVFSDCDGLFDGEVHTIALKSILGDFGPEELADCVDIAEKLYFSTEKPVILCLAMDPSHDVTVEEMDIKSEADFTIRLALIDVYKVALQKIKERIEEGTVDEVDQQVLMNMPMFAPENRRRELRTECFKLLSEL